MLFVLLRMYVFLSHWFHHGERPFLLFAVMAENINHILRLHIVRLVLSDTLNFRRGIESFFFSTIVIFLRVFRFQLNEAASHSLPLPTLSSSLFTKCISTGQSHFLGLHCYLNDCLCLKAILSRVAAEAK